MRATIGEANFTLRYSPPPVVQRYTAHVIYETGLDGNGDMQFNESDISVAVATGVSGAAFIAAFLAAVDAEAVRIGLPAPTDVFGHQLTKFR